MITLKPSETLYVKPNTFSAVQIQIHYINDICGTLGKVSKRSFLNCMYVSLCVFESYIFFKFPEKMTKSF